MQYVVKGGLALSGGGARGAYQAGVLKALAEIAIEVPEVKPFQIITGVSSGAVNSTYFASQAQNFQTAAETLCDLWRKLTPDQVFKVDSFSLFSNSAKVLKKLMFGGSAKDSPRKHQLSLLNTEPSRKLFSDKIHFPSIQENIDKGYIDALALSATDYATSFGVTFVQSKPHTPMWERKDRFSVLTEISCDHVLASSAIPIFFPSVTIGQRYFGDGCLRNTAPLSPAIRLGANKLIIVSVRKGFAARPSLDQAAKEPGIGKILNTIINSVLMDGMEMDMQRLIRINETLQHIHSDEGKIQANLHPIDFIFIRPTEDIGEIAKKQRSHMPKGIQYLLSGLGNPDETADIMSYLLFEGSFCNRLIEMGYADGIAKKDEIIHIFRKK